MSYPEVTFFLYLKLTCTYNSLRLLHKINAPHFGRSSIAKWQLLTAVTLCIRKELRRSAKNKPQQVSH